MVKRPKLKYHNEMYDALVGEYLIAQARKIEKRRVQKSKTHRGQIADIKGDVKDRCTECGTLLRGDMAHITGRDSVCFISKAIRAIKGKDNQQKTDSGMKGIKYKK